MPHEVGRFMEVYAADCCGALYLDMKSCKTHEWNCSEGSH